MQYLSPKVFYLGERICPVNDWQVILQSIRPHSQNPQSFPNLDFSALIVNSGIYSIEPFDDLNAKISSGLKSTLCRKNQLIGIKKAIQVNL